MTLDVSREQVLAYRAAAHQFDRTAEDPDVLDLGVQDTPYGSAALALAARGVRPDGLALVWGVRGAPHLHRRADLPALASALWPVSDADASARFVTTPVKAAAPLGVEAFRVTAGAFRDSVTEAMPKGEVSTAVSARVPESLTFWCKTCDARHVSGAIFQLAGLAGGVELAVQGSSTRILPIGEPGFPVPERAEGVREYVETYLRLLGPATPGEVAKFLNTSVTVAKTLWPDGLAEVTVDGKKAWLPESSLDALREARKPSWLRLIPPGDPFLQARDRHVLAPDKAREKQMWRPIGNPGVVLLGGEPAGTWRTKLSGRRLDLTVTPFVPLPEDKLRDEAELLARTRGASDVRVL